MNKKTSRKAVSPLSGASIPVPGPGRPKGARNKISGTAKENIVSVFEKLGGIEGMFGWAGKNDRNRGIFYQSIYSKILPMDIYNQHSGAIDSAVNIKIVRTIVEQKNGA